jgi:hypothetical protein
MRALIVVAALGAIALTTPWDLFATVQPMPQPITAGCPATVRHAELPDVPLGHGAREAVDCLVHHGIVDVAEDGRFHPDGAVTAATVSTWMRRSGALLGTDLGGSPPDPDRILRRGELAEVVAAALEKLGATPRPANLPYDDVTREDAVNPVAVAGLVPVRERGAFGVADPADRAMAAITVARTLAYLSAHGDVSLDAPSPPVWGEVPPGRLPFLPGAEAAEDTYAFEVPLRHDGTYVRFNPCRPVRVVANLTHAPDFGEEAIIDALGKLTAAMGTEWIYDGETDEQLDHGRQGRAAMSEDVPGRPGPVLITWPEEWPRSWTGHDALAYAESQMLDDEEIATGSVRVNPEEAWTYDRLVWVLLHELGHVAGLGHPEDADQVMYRSVADVPGDPDLRDGDRAGLAQLGRPAGCF